MQPRAELLPSVPSASAKMTASAATAASTPRIIQRSRLLNGRCVWIAFA